MPDGLEAHVFGRSRSSRSWLEMPGRGSAMASSTAAISSGESDSSSGRAFSNAATTGSTSAVEARAGFGALTPPV